MTNPTSNFGWQMPTSTDLVTDLPADFETFGQAVDTSLADLKGGTSGQVLSKASNTDMDFTWVTSDDANAIQNTIVDAKGDLISATGSDVPARLAVGANGETLVADSSTSTGLRYQAVQTRNCVYNSSFEIAQRGTSFTANGYMFDRWYGVTAGIAGRTISRVAGTGQFQYLTRIQRTAGNTATNGVDFGQPFEIADSTPYAGKTVTVSFYARKGADFSGTFSLFVFSGTSSTETNRVTTAYPSGAATPLNTGSITLTTTLTRYQYTFTFGASVTQFCILPSVGWSGTAGAADLVEFTGFQLEVGSVATDYVRQGATIQGELAACQRYYQLIASGTQKFLAAGSVYTASQLDILLTFPEMRIAPSLVATSGTGYYNFIRNGGSDVFNSITLNGYTTPRGAALYNNTEISSTAGNAGWIYLDNASASVALSAEL